MIAVNKENSLYMNASEGYSMGTDKKDSAFFCRIPIV